MYTCVSIFNNILFLVMTISFTHLLPCKLSNILIDQEFSFNLEFDLIAASILRAPVFIPVVCIQL